MVTEILLLEDWLRGSRSNSSTVTAAGTELVCQCPAPLILCVWSVWVSLRKQSKGAPRHSDINEKNPFPSPTVHTLSGKLHLCSITQHVVPIVTTMRVCSAARWLRTAALKSREPGLNPAWPGTASQGQVSGISLLSSGRYNLIDGPSSRTRLFDVRKASLCMVCVRRVFLTRVKKEGYRGKKAMKGKKSTYLGLSISSTLYLLNYINNDFTQNLSIFYSFLESTAHENCLALQPCGTFCTDFHLLQARKFFRNTCYDPVFGVKRNHWHWWFPFFCSPHGFRILSTFPLLYLGSWSRSQDTSLKGVPNVLLECRI